MGIKMGLIGGVMSYEAFYKRMKAFDQFYYCIYDDMHPREILEMDNNLEIVFYLRSGKTKKELRNNGIEFKISQLSLLKSYNLIREEKGRYFSKVLFFPEYEARELRKSAKDVAVRVAASVSAELKGLLGVLTKMNIPENAFSILFSYVLDTLVWENLRTLGYLKKLKIDRKNPNWDGIIWMVEPKRKNAPGTVCMSSGNVSLCRTTCPLKKKDMTDSSLLSSAADSFRSTGKVHDKKARKHLEELGIYDDGIKIPVIKAAKDDALFKASIALGTVVAQNVALALQSEQNFRIFNDLEKWKSTIIYYHEIMWEIMDILVMAGELQKPAALIDESKNDLKEVMYIVSS